MMVSFLKGTLITEGVMALVKLYLESIDTFVFIFIKEKCIH